MSTFSFKVSEGLYLVKQELDVKAPKKEVDVPVNHVAVIDCSGSMSWELPKIREQLKKKLPKLLRDKDTISVIWFSGRSEFGVLLEGEPVASLADLKDVNQAIDRWLKPVGLTGFKEPLEEVPNLVARVAKKTPGSVFSLFFMSDGCDNQWPRADVLKAAEKAAGSLASATFVEYGYYADRPLLASMAEKAGGSTIFADDFDKYAPAFEAAMQRKVSGAPRIEAAVAGDPVLGFAFMMVNGEITTFDASAGKVSVPEDSSTLWYLSSSCVGSQMRNVVDISKVAFDTDGDGLGVTDAAFAAVSLFSLRMKPDVVYPLLSALGDVRLIELFSTCFGKQKYSEFMETAKEAAFGKGRFEKGWDPNKVPRDDAFTVLELLDILSSDDDTRLLLEHESFKYSRISRARVDASEKLTDEETKELQDIAGKMALERDVSKVKELQDRLSELTAKKVPSLKFETAPAPEGYEVSGLTYNETRPNISVRVQKPGTVDISSRLPENLKGKVPDKFDSFVYRNYAVVKDGLVNVEKLPVKISAKTAAALDKAWAPGFSELQRAGDADIDLAVILDLKALPIVNRKMVKSVSARVLFEKEYELAQAQGRQKVYNHYKKEHFPRVSEGFEQKYGTEATTWLKEQGLTDFSGFSPKSVQAESKDFYNGKELVVSLKGLSSLPTVAKLKEMVAKGKVNDAGSLMLPALNEVDGFLASSVYKSAKKPEAVFEAWLDGQQEDARKTVRGLIGELAVIKFSVIVGQVWFQEFKSLDENTMDVTVGGKTLSCKVEAREVEIKI